MYVLCFKAYDVGATVGVDDGVLVGADEGTGVKIMLMYPLPLLYPEDEASAVPFT